MLAAGESGVAFSGLVEAMWGGQPGAGLTPIASQSRLAGGDGHMLAADIWRIRKRGVRVPWLLAGAFGLGSGDAKYQLATLARALSLEA